MSFKKAVNIEDLPISESLISEEMNELSKSIHNSIENDLSSSLMKSNIDFSQLMPQMVSNPKMKSKTNLKLNNETHNISELNSRLDEMKAKIMELNEENNEQIINNDMDCDEKETDLDMDHTNRLRIEFPAFKRIYNTLAQNCEKHSNVEKNRSNSKIIDVNNEEISKALQIAKHIEHFQNISHRLKSFENKKN